MIVGVVILGRPVARLLQDGFTAEVTRLATLREADVDGRERGPRNACSLLYAAAWRVARALGYRRLVTYTLPEEGGASLHGAGWRCVGEAGGGLSRDDRPRFDSTERTCSFAGGSHRRVRRMKDDWLWHILVGGLRQHGKISAKDAAEAIRMWRACTESDADFSTISAKPARKAAVSVGGESARPSAAEYPYKYRVTFLGPGEARDFMARALRVGMGGVGYVRKGAVVTFRTQDALTMLERPGKSPDAIVRLTHAFDAPINPAVVSRGDEHGRREPRT